MASKVKKDGKTPPTAATNLIGSCFQVSWPISMYSNVSQPAVLRV
jgi:hypothetical protein